MDIKLQGLYDFAGRAFNKSSLADNKKSVLTVQYGEANIFRDHRSDALWFLRILPSQGTKRAIGGAKDAGKGRKVRKAKQVELASFLGEME